MLLQELCQIEWLHCLWYTRTVEIKGMAGLWRSWERASIALKRSRVRIPPGPFFDHACTGNIIENKQKTVIWRSFVFVTCRVIANWLDRKRLALAKTAVVCTWIARCLELSPLKFSVDSMEQLKAVGLRGRFGLVPENDLCLGHSARGRHEQGY